MISKLKKFVLFITATLFVGTSSVFANDINQQTTDPVNINQDNTTINFTDQGCINYTNTSNLPGTISIDNNSANDISNLTINVENSSFSKWWGTHVTSSSEGGLDSYAIDLSNAKSGFRLNFAGKQDSAGQNSTGTYFRANSNISDSEDNNPKSAVIYLPEAVSNDVNDRTMVNFGTINANLESNIQKIASYDPCASTTIGIPILNTAGANNISLQKDQSNNGSTFSSQASAIDNGDGYQFDEVDSTVFGCGKISTSRLTEGAECNQLCNFDLSNFDLSKDTAISNSSRYASIIGAGKVNAFDGGNDVTINQLNNLHIKNLPNVYDLHAGTDNYPDANACATVLGCAYIDASVTHGTTSDNIGKGIFQFNNAKINTVSGTVWARTSGNNTENSASIIGCANVNVSIGEEGSEDIISGHTEQFNNFYIENISGASGYTLLSSESYGPASVIGGARDTSVINGNAENSTISSFNSLKIGNIGTAVKLSAKSTGSSAVVVGQGSLQYDLSGKRNEIKQFNNVIIGDIIGGAELQSSSMICSAIIGNADEIFTINAINSTIEEFSNLKVGGISGELNASGGSYAAVIGIGRSNHTLNGNDSKVQRFNDVTIGGINVGAKLSSTSKSDCAAIIGSPYETFIVNATNSTIEEFGNLKIGEGNGISGELNTTGKNSSVVLGLGYSSYTLNGNDNKIQRFNDVMMGDINGGAKLSSTSISSRVAVIGSAFNELKINKNAKNSIIEEFNNLKIGEGNGISGELNATSTGQNSSGKNSSAVLGEYSSYTLNGSDSKVQRFNDVTIGNINNGAKLNSAANSDCAAVIGNAGEVLTIGAENLTIEEFNNLKIGEGDGISGELNASGGSYAAVIGIGRSNHTLNGSDGKVQRFHSVTIGDINSGAKLGSTSNLGRSVVIGNASETSIISKTNSIIEEFNNLKVGGGNGISGELNATGKQCATIIGSGQSNYTLNGSNSNVQIFNDMAIGDITEAAKLSSFSELNFATVIGNADETFTIGAENSTIEEFNRLKVEGISGKLHSTGVDYATVIGLGCSEHNLNGIAGTVKSFNTLKVGNIAGNLIAECSEPDVSSAVVIGQGDFIVRVPGEDIIEERFNNLTIGDITSSANLNASSGDGSAIIGNVYEDLDIGKNAGNFSAKIFNNLKIGEIYGSLNATGTNSSAIIGSGGQSKHKLRGSNNEIQRFNKVTIGDITGEANISSSSGDYATVIGCSDNNEVTISDAMNSKIEEFNDLKVGNISNPSISSSSGEYATVIGSARTLATIDDTATGSTINQFNNLEVGNISGSTDESSRDNYIAKSGYASIIGIANYELNLSGSDNNIKFFNDAKIGDITKGSFIKSEANETRDISISTVIGCANVSAVIDENTNESAVELFNGLEVKDISGTMCSGYYGGYNVYSKYASVIGMANSDFKLNGQENHINFFNDVSIGNVTSDSVIKAGANENKELSSSILIGSANTSITINSGSGGSTIESFANLSVGNIAGNLDSGYDGSYNVKSKCASIIGAASSEFNLDGESNHIKFFENCNIGNIANDNIGNTINVVFIDDGSNGQFIGDVSNVGYSSKNGHIKSGANLYATVIGSANTSITINNASKDSIIESFTNLRIGNISGKLDSGYDGSYNVKSKCASIIGAASSEFTMSGEDSHINFFNDVSIGNISSAELSGDIGSNKAPIKSGASSYTTVIGNAHDSVTVDESANESTINIFDDLKIGDISTYEINAGYDANYNIHSPNTSIVGTAFSTLILNGENNRINYFNDVNIGNVEGSTLRSGATECATVVGSANIDIAANSNVVGSEINLFNNLVMGDASGCVLKSEVEHGYGSVIGCAKFVCNDTSKIKIFSNVSSQFHGNTVISSISKNDNLSLNTLGGCYNGYYGGEENNIADGMRFYFNGIGNSNSNIVVAALEQNGSNYFLKNNCRAFSIGPNFQINVGRERLLEGNLFGFETEDSVINGGVKSGNAAGVLHILGDVEKAPYNDSCENSVMRVDGGWDAQCFGRISDLRNIDIIEGSLSLMGTSNSAKAELETAIKQVDEYGCFPNYEDRKPNGSLTLAEGQTLCFGVSSEIVDNEINERFGNDNGAFKTVNGKLLMRNDGLNDQNVLSLKGGKLSVADTSSSTVSPNACFYVIRADVPHDEKTNGNLINIDPNLYKISDENFNTNQILGNVSMYKITDTQDQSIVTGIKGALAKKELNAYKAYDTDEKNIGIVIVSGEDKPDDPDYGTDDPDPSQDHGSDINDPSQDPEPGPEPDQGSEDSDHHQLGPIGPTLYIDVEPDPDPIPGPHIVIGGDDAIDLDVIDLISKSNTNVVVAQGIADTISSVVGSALDVDTHSNYGFDGDFLHREDNDYLASIIRGESRVRYIGGGNYSMASQYKTRYSLNPKLFFSPFGEHGHQDKVSDLGYNYNLYGFTVGGRLAKYLQSGASIKFGIFGSVSDNTTKYCGEKSHLGMRNNQKMYFGGVFGSYEDYDISDFRTNLSIVIGGGRFKNKTWTRITNGGKVRAKFNSSDFHASADFVKNMINIGNSGFHCGPWVALSYNHIHENGHNVVCNGENIANVSSTRFDFLDTTLGINFEKNILYSPEKNISGRIFAKAGWFCRPVRSHSSCTIRADGIDPVNSEFRFSDRNAAIVSGGFKFEFNKKWELSASITSRIAKHHWLINGNALIGYSF